MLVAHLGCQDIVEILDHRYILYFIIPSSASVEEVFLCFSEIILVNCSIRFVLFLRVNLVKTVLLVYGVLLAQR